MFFQDLLAFFENGHIKNVQNRFLESLSHAEIHEYFNMGDKIHAFMHEYFPHS